MDFFLCNYYFLFYFKLSLILFNSNIYVLILNRLRAIFIVLNYKSDDLWLNKVEVPNPDLAKNKDAALLWEQVIYPRIWGTLILSFLFHSCNIFFNNKLLLIVTDGYLIWQHRNSVTWNASTRKCLKITDS